MADGVFVTEIFNQFPELPEMIQHAVARVVRKTAFDIQRNAARNAPVDTGFLKTSIYVAAHNSSNYATRSQAALSKNPHGELFDEVDDPPADGLTAYVAVGANYGLFVELGTVHNPSRPFLVPAAEAALPGYIAALKALEALLPGVGLFGTQGNISGVIEEGDTIG